MQAVKRFFTEYILLNFFIFGCVGLLSLIFLNISFFDPFTEAFKDFSLTDLYYTKVKDRNDIYKGPVVLINVENRNRKEITFLFEQIQQGQPKVVALDMLFAQRQNEQDSFLKAEFAKKTNYVFSYIADFENEEETVYNDTFFTTTKNGYANMVGENRAFTTIRFYHPFTHNKESFTSSIIKAYDIKLYADLLKKKNKQLEIHYSGNLSNFQYYNFDEVLSPNFDAAVLKNKIVLVGYLGLVQTTLLSKVDEDKFFTPLNNRLSGRSFPDMYGCVIHANILQMIFEKNYIKVVPQWRMILISFLIIWLFLPIMCGLFFKGDLWFNAAGTLVQLAGSIFIVFFSVGVYRYFNTKFDPGLLMGCFVLLPTFINLYEALLKFLHYKLKLPFRSRFLDKDHND